MEKDIYKYLNLISDHLQNHHAALFVGAGFSRNARKIDDKLPDSPDWAQLAEIFVNKLSSDQSAQKELRRLSPLILAEHVEVIYGRSELEYLLQNSIRDRDYFPSDLHHQLLSLPWSDIFTTNYDTLLERASEEITEKSFLVVTSKEDLIGSAGSTRIVKLHGSFPSQRPFIITSEDYRTYPLRFAPFVNTVQQSLLENTLCLIGFSGNDPNFEKWIGWIRDNLGENNAPNIYLLLHYSPSEAECELMRRKKIIPVDLSCLAPDKPVFAVYEAALNYLKQQCCRMPENWDLEQAWGGMFIDGAGQLPSIEDAFVSLKKIRESYPGWLIVPSGQREFLRLVLSGAEEILVRHLSADSPVTDTEIEYLYEYDWLREKTLLPPFSELRFYHQILKRHPKDHIACKISIQLSLLRDLRECGDWEGWDKLRDEISEEEVYINIEQRQQLLWEECLCSLWAFQFQDLNERLNNWKVEPSMSLWALRKAGILAENGNINDAHILLQQAILSIRGRLSRQKQTNIALLSLESALMYLQSYVLQAQRHDKYCKLNGKDEEQIEEETEVDSKHRVFHAQYRVVWEDQNAYFISGLENEWQPNQLNRTRSTFDFQKKRENYRIGENKDLILAYSFLRFREESGIPFCVNNVLCGQKAACGAAERIALYAPSWSILTLVRASEPNNVGYTITRGVLSSWSRERADQSCRFYIGAVLRTESELGPNDWFYRKNFVRLAADVLPEVISELCLKSSSLILDKCFGLLKMIYQSERKLCYHQTSSFAKRLFTAYTPEKLQLLVPELLLFPISKDDAMIANNFPDPLELLPRKSAFMLNEAEKVVPEVENMFVKLRQKKDTLTVISRLLYCFSYGILTKEEKQELGEYLWEGQQLHVPNNWLRTVCLDIPAPAHIDKRQYLSKTLIEDVEGYSGRRDRPKNDTALLQEIQIFTLKVNGAFLDEQISMLISCFSDRLITLFESVSKEGDLFGLKEFSLLQIYNIAHALWLLTCSIKAWIPSESDRQKMSNILALYNKSGICHCGLQIVWNRVLGSPLDSAKELENCLRSTEEKNSRWAYEVLAVSVCNPQISLLTEKEIKLGIMVLIQQIIWGIPKQLTSALNVTKEVLNNRPDLISEEIWESLITGIAQLKRQSIINADDTVEMASDKGNIRIYAASLAKRMYQTKLFEKGSEILNEWIAIIGNENEFAEIRNV